MGAVQSRQEVKAFTGLINFDQRARVYIAACTILFFLLVLFKIHGSSIALWNNKGPADKDIDARNGLLMGMPKTIRIDEWSRNTPFILSQYSQGFPKNNSSYGAENNALASNMPVKDITTILRPTYWGFFLFDVERGFAWYWHFRTCILLIGFFLMLMLLTKSNFRLSVFGSLWVLFSSATQWWYSAMLPEIIAHASMMFVSAVYFMYSVNMRIVALSVLSFVIFSFSFVTVLYPPWLICAGYLIGILLIGYMMANPIRGILLDKRIFLRAGMIGAGMLLLGASAAYFYLEIKGFAAILQATVYPGSRKFEGGDISVSRLFLDYLLFVMKENTVPAEMYNICEASGYILFFPGILAALFLARSRGVKIPLVFWLLAGYLLLLVLWSLVGLPGFVSKILLLDKVSGYRASSFIGVANIVLVVLFLNECKRFYPALTVTMKGILLLGILAFLYIIMGKINFIFTDKVAPSRLLGLAVYLTLMHFCLFAKWKWADTLFFTALLPLLFVNFLVNPISSGLDPILRNPLYTFMNDEVKKKFPEGRWIVFGQNSPVVANLLKASGVKVFGGVNVSPDLKEMELLDSEKKYSDVYNRYIDQFNIFPAAPDSKPEFKLNFGDAITLAVDPCYPKLKDLGIRYSLFLYGPGQAETRCLKPLDSKYPYPVFMFNDSSGTVASASVK